jgi:hypothetical protein
MRENYTGGGQEAVSSTHDQALNIDDINGQINELRDKAGQIRDGEVPMLDQAGRGKLIAATEDEVYRLEALKVDSINEHIIKQKENIRQIEDGEVPMLSQVSRDELITTAENEIRELEARKIDSVSDKIGRLKEKIRQIEDGEVSMLDQVGRDKLITTTENEIRELEERKKDSISYRISKLREDIRQLEDGEVSMLDQAGRDKLIATAEAEISELEAQIKPPTDPEGVPENLPVRSLEESVEGTGGGHEGEESESSEDTETIDKAEYLRLKKEFKESQRAYMEALEQDYADRNIIKKVLGLGRKEFSSPVQDAYDRFMAANQEYYSFSQQSGAYEKIAERLNRERSRSVFMASPDGGDVQVVETPSPDTMPNMNFLVADRHILRPAEERLERQKLYVPGQRKIKALIKKHPKKAMAAAVAIGGTMAILNPIGFAAAFGTGLGVKYAGNRFYVSGKENEKSSSKESIIAEMDEYTSLEDLEAQYFEDTRQTHQRKMHTNTVAFGAAVAAGATANSMYGMNAVAGAPTEGTPFAVGGETVDVSPRVDETLEAARDLYEQNRGMFSGTVEEVGATNSSGVEAEADLAGNIEEAPEVIPEQPLEPEVIPPSVAPETIHTVERGEVLSKIVLDALRERVLAGEVQLPESVDQDRLAHYMYQSFPEMTNASDIQPRLSAAEWQELGVQSGDPQLIRPGEEINIQSLFEKLWGAQPGSPTGSETIVPPPETVTAPVEPVSAVDVPVEAAAGMEQSAGVLGVEVGGEPSAPTADASVEEPSVIAPAGGDEVTPISTADSGEVIPVALSESQEVGGAGADTEALPVSGEEVPSAPAENQERWLYDEPRIAHNLAEVTGGGYEPYVSERLTGMVTTWPEQGAVSLHEYLYQTMLQGFHTGHITLPNETMEYVLDNETALYGFIEKHMPDVSEHTLSKFFRGVGPNALSSGEWQALGIESGNPKMIDPGEQVQTGEIIRIMLERAATAVNKT